MPESPSRRLITGRRAALRSLIAGCLACGVTACRSERTPGVFTDQAFADSTRTTAVLDSARLDRAEPPHLTLSLPDTVRDFEMARPSGVAIRPGGSCLIAVSDYGETAVHYFSSPSRYLRTLFLGGRGRRALSGLGPISLAADGRAYIGELGRRRLVAVDSALTGWRVFQSDSVVPDMPAVSAVVAASPDRLLENWMVERLPMPSGDWAGARLPLVRLLDTLGGAVGGFWRIAGRPGTVLTSALNHGYMAVRGDTIWFAYATSGQVRRGVMQRAGSGSTLVDTATFILPRMFRPVAPQLFRLNGDTVGIVTLDDQITAFTVTPRGRIVVGQTISYPPRAGRALHIPHSALAIYGPSGRFIRGWRAGGRIIGVAADQGIIAAIVQPSGDSPTAVRVYRMPESSPALGDGGACGGQGAAE